MLLAYIVLVLYGSYLLYDNVIKTGCDPSGALGTPCTPDASDVFGDLLGITFDDAVMPQESEGNAAFTDARHACSHPYR
jgi:hypothetical protein